MEVEPDQPRRGTRDEGKPHAPGDRRIALAWPVLTARATKHGSRRITSAPSRRVVTNEAPNAGPNDPAGLLSHAVERRGKPPIGAHPAGWRAVPP